MSFFVQMLPVGTTFDMTPPVGFKLYSVVANGYALFAVFVHGD